MGRPKGSKNKNEEIKDKSQEEPKTLDNRLSELERDFGLKRASIHNDPEYLHTGVYALDYVLGKGIQLVEGGHKIEFYGKESSGKTSFALLTVKAFQQKNKVCVWIVSESFRESWAKKLGVNTEKLLLVHPESAEEAGDLIVKLIPKTDLIVVDSVASLIPQAEIDRDLDEPTRGAQAKTYSAMCRKIYDVIDKYKTTILFINQLREKMNVMYGNPEDTPCGRALKFMYDTRIEFKTGTHIEQGTGDNKERIGKEILIYGKKNKLDKPHRKQTINFYYDGYVDNKASLLFAGIQYGIIEFSGKTYKYKELKAVGKDNFINLVEDKQWQEIEKEIWKNLK